MMTMKTVAVAAAAVLGLACATPTPSATVTASPTAVPAVCHTTSGTVPAGDCGPFKQVFADSFSTVVPVGSFTSCAGDGDFRCAGLKTKYPAVYNAWGAYPRGWYDTAHPANHSNGNGRTHGGEYRADDTVSVFKQPNADGQMRVRMYRPAAGGDNHVAALVPRACMNMRYGKFTERLIVRTRTDGFKMAHLRYSPDEVDYPEAGGNFSTDPVSWFTHGFSEDGGDVAPGSAWTAWHTYSTEITPSGVRFFLDGKLVGQTSGDFPEATPWVLQNESSLDGGYAAPGSSVEIDTTWVTCYRYAP
jgi:hypothetical protein